MRRRESNRGFTLIEVLLAITLLAVLGGSAAVQRFQLERRELPGALEDAGLGGRLDPWGRPYRYYNVEANGRGGARKDRRLNPLNTDFDLYSLGKDGRTRPQISQRDSEDDIIRASNGRFVGKAIDY
jgi:general secretion pathway protein G